MTVFLSKDHNEDVYSFNVGSIAIHEMIDSTGLWKNLDILYEESKSDDHEKRRLSFDPLQFCT